MSMIRFFTSNGIGANSASEVIDYLMSQYSALSEEQRKQYLKLSYLIKKAISAGCDANELIKQRNNIHGSLRNPAPMLLTTHTNAVIYAISISPHKYKYNSGVIAFADSDNEKLIKNPHIEREYRLLFQEIVFAGLPASARLIEWVRHTHAGNVENHFVIPRIHLRTGRYFNAYPPCSAQDFNVLKAFMDTKYGLTANTSIEHQQLFGHVGPYDPQRKLKLKIYEQLELFCSQNGQSITRDSVKDFFEDTYIKQLFSLKEIKQKHDYLQVFIEGKTKAIRLTGAAFQQPRKSGLPQEDLPLHISEHSDHSFRDYTIADFAIIRSLISGFSSHF